MKITPKDFFMHLGALVALYVAAGALINLSFGVINYYFPDALAGYFYGNAVAWPISMLIVLVPILYVLEWVINRDIATMPEKAYFWMRTWRIYIILFSAVILVGGDLIALINTYLNGEISSRFIYKFIAILLIGGTVGKYYFFSLYPNFRWAKLARTVQPWFGIVLVLAAIIAGFIAVGSPASQRAYRFDTQRVNDLTSIQGQVVSYWQQKNEKLPATLADLNDPLSWFTVPLDPETKASYEYSVKSDLSFELCATFSRATRDDEGRGEYGYGKGGVSMAYPAYDVGYPIISDQDNWKHEEGRTCFTRTIDPDRYQIDKPEPVGI
jgi:hypothetical protein